MKMRTHLIYFIFLVIILLKSSEIALKNILRARIVLKVARPIIIFVIISIILSFLFLILSKLEAKEFLNAISFNIFQFFLFGFCLIAGFTEGAKTNLPAFPFLHLGWKGANYLKRRGFPTFSLKRFFRIFFLMIFGSISIWIFFSPEITKETQEIFEKSGFAQLSLILSVLSAAIIEETVFRFFLQTELIRYLKIPAVGIIITSAIWAMGHSGMVIPSGVKELQIFYVGIILGIIRNYWGIEICILLHLLMNILFSLFFFLFS